MNLKTILLILWLAVPLRGVGQTLGSYQSYEKSNHQLLFTSDSGAKLSLKAYSAFTIRVQAVRKGEEFFADDHYEMVADHTQRGEFYIQDKGAYFDITTGTNKGVRIKVIKNPITLEFCEVKGGEVYLRDNGLSWNKSQISASFVPDTAEHFCGLGHQAFGLVPKLDLKDQVVTSNYGAYENNTEEDTWLPQAALTVPFFMSSKGYGVFVNSTFPHLFNFGKKNQFQFQLDTKGFAGRLDYFFFLGPRLDSVLDRYTQLTGRPRLPQKSIFGLHLSDKDSPANEGENWWKAAIKAHREAGFPLDHIVNDNRWRAGSGAWAGSWFEWDKTRYPNPAEYKKWSDENGLTMTLDLNRNSSALCAGYNSSFNIPGSSMVKESYSVPDYSSPVVRNWLWTLFWTKSFDPALQYPGDGLWMDETDELTNLPDSVICANGRSWAENKNYYQMLVAKAVVQEGWENANQNTPAGIGEAKRPFMWSRGSVAGAQRYATHWSGDLQSTYGWMQKTIRGMLASGLSGFPYFNHDAGGFRAPGPDDAMYVQWAMAFGSFSPIWRPHGESGSPRWPLNRSKICQVAATNYAHLRYEQMPYIYTAAHQAYAHGTPMARAMLLDYPNEPAAWKHDLQYLWGPAMLVAPLTSAKDSTLKIWLPPGQAWYYLWNDKQYAGGQEIAFAAKAGELPVFVKAGAIIPKYEFALSTFWQKPEKLILDIYPGQSGSYTLYEDDGVTEKFRLGACRQTLIEYDEARKQVRIKADKGSYTGAPSLRSYTVCLHSSTGIRIFETKLLPLKKEVVIRVK